ncbi:hypothetical protein LJC40_01225 [Synergistaceae bacterium OttesenSCG-928-D05]|nr:hypothetical protein [Synergistaceae bacterium OttesenSCG-928-D05]
MAQKFSYPALLSFGYDGGRLWVANFVGLSGCWVEGTDRADVIARAPDVLGEYISFWAAAGMPLPKSPDLEELRKLNAGEVILVETVIKKAEC